MAAEKETWEFVPETQHLLASNYEDGLESSNDSPNESSIEKPSNTRSVCTDSTTALVEQYILRQYLEYQNGLRSRSSKLVDPGVGLEKGESPNEASTPKPSTAHYVCVNFAIVLATCFLVIPLLTFIAVPNVFIVTGMRRYLETYFYPACYIATGFGELTFFILTCWHKTNTKSFRDALLSALGETAAGLGIMIGATLLTRLMYYPMVLFLALACLAWDLLGGIIGWLWGGMVVLKGAEWSWWDEMDRKWEPQ